jgi:hypothetical protein
MSFRSDVSFPEPVQWNGEEEPMEGSAYNERFSRDAHHLWTAIRDFRTQYGEANLQRVIVIAESKK